MFKKLTEAVDGCTQQVAWLAHQFQSMSGNAAQNSHDIRKRLESIETWMELAVDTKAEEIADRFDELLREHSKTGKITNQVLKDLVKQAAKGQ